jgi:anti-anti-sigma factor
MRVKTDTKERFTVITPEESALTANMAAFWLDSLREYLSKPVPHLIINMSDVRKMDLETGGKLAELQQEFYERNCSLVVCCLQEQVEKTLDEEGLLEIMNVTPTESEAWDIVQMEEIERELMGEFDDDDSSTKSSESTD